MSKITRSNAKLIYKITDILIFSVFLIGGLFAALLFLGFFALLYFGVIPQQQ